VGRFLNGPHPRPRHHLLLLRRVFVPHLTVNELSLNNTRINTMREFVDCRNKPPLHRAWLNHRDVVMVLPDSEAPRSLLLMVTMANRGDPVCLVSRLQPVNTVVTNYHAQCTAHRPLPSCGPAVPSRRTRSVTKTWPTSRPFLSPAAHRYCGCDELNTAKFW
jgi:hypothetical protein